MLMQLNFTLAKHCNKAKLARASQSVVLGRTFSCSGLLFLLDTDSRANSLETQTSSSAAPLPVSEHNDGLLSRKIMEVL